MNTFEFGENKIHYSVKRTSRRRSVGIQVTPDAGVVFRVPRWFSGSLNRVLEKHASWILKKQDFLKTHFQEKEKQEVVSVEALKQYRLQAFQKIGESIARFQPLIGIPPKKISIRNQKTRWGSCNKRHHLSFNWRLVLLPSEILDYVVVHELCHMVHLNHSKSFWGKVESILPDYREKRRWLRAKPVQFYG